MADKSFFFFQRTLKIQIIILLQIIQTMTRVKRSSCNGYLAKGMVSDPIFNEVNSTIALSLPLFLWTISKDRHSFSSANIWLVSGLSTSIGEVHDMAISTTFHAELMSNLTCNLASTMLRISPLLTIGVTHWSMWMFSPDALCTSAFRPVINSNRTIPKLKISFFLFVFPVIWNLF